MGKGINYQLLRDKIKSMTRYTLLYKVLKKELSAKGYWKNLKRGNPEAGYKAMQEAKQRIKQRANIAL